MGLVGKLVGIGFFVIVVLVVVAFVPDVFASLQNWIADVFNASFFIIKPQAGEIICNLRINTNVDIVQNDPLAGVPILGGFVAPEFEIPRNNPYTFEYFGCVAPSGFALANLVDAGFGKAPDIRSDTLAELQPNSFVTINELGLGTTITQQIRLVDSSDTTQKVDWVLSPNLSYTSTLPTGIIETPYPLDAEFVIPNIPVRVYNLEIHLLGLDKGINGMRVGDPYLGQICNNFQTFSAGKCF